MLSIEIPKEFSVEEASQFKEEVNNMIAKGKKDFTLNFKNCTFIDSTGLGVIVGVYKRCIEMNGSLRLCSISDSKVKKVFQLTRLDKVFKIE